MIKYWRVMILVVMVIASLLAIGFKTYPYGRNGVEILYVTNDSLARGTLEHGMIITAVNGVPIKNNEEWMVEAAKIIGSTSYKLTSNGKNYDFESNDTVKDLGIIVSDIERFNLQMGLDLKGGTRIILQPTGENITEETIDSIIATLQTRANLYGLREINFYPVKGVGDDNYVQIEAAGIGSNIVDELLSKQGNFEAKITKPIELSGGKGVIELLEKIYEVEAINIDNETFNIIVEGNEYSPGDKFSLEGIEFEYLNATENEVGLLGTVYSGKDIEIIYTDPQRSGIYQSGNFFTFYFTVQISQEGAERFAKITSGIPKYINFNSGEEYLNSQLILYLDGNLVDALNIGGSLGGQIVKNPQVQGSRETRDSAIEEKLNLQTILRSGALPTKMETVSVDIVSPRLGSEFFSSALTAAILGAIIVVAIVFVRYRSFKIGIPMVLTAISEIVIILGIAATNDTYIWGGALIINIAIVITALMKKEEIDIFAWVGAILMPLIGLMTWTIDLPAIAGIIAAIGTGVDHQIIIADETLSGEAKKRIYGLKDKIKMAFFIIFGAASTTIAAMVPLLFVGIGLVRGFAITTIVGVLVGVLIARPAYAKIIERVLGKE